MLNNSVIRVRQGNVGRLVMDSRQLTPEQNRPIQPQSTEILPADELPIRLADASHERDGPKPMNFRAAVKEAYNR